MATKKGRKKTGGRYKKNRKKKAYERKGQAVPVKLGPIKRKTKRTRGGNTKTILLSANVINIRTKNNKVKKVKIKNVLETPSNRFLARQNILTKGTIVETELGKAKITNRPSQEGCVNGVLIEK